VFARIGATMVRPLSARPAQTCSFRKVLCNEAIEQVVEEPLSLEHLTVGHSLHLSPRHGAAAATWMTRRWRSSAATASSSLSLAEMRHHPRATSRRASARDPPPTSNWRRWLRTWSEHCSHKTLKGTIEFHGEDGEVRRYDNLLRETIFAATQEIRRRLGPDDWCVSVFRGQRRPWSRFDDRFHVCLQGGKRNNHPSAIEPYGGGQQRGLGGVIRDPASARALRRPAGLPNTERLLFSLHPIRAPESLPPGVAASAQGDAGAWWPACATTANRMGIPHRQRGRPF